jgi:hypothetical protein
MGLLLLSPAARSQSPTGTAITALIGIHLNTSAFIAVRQTDRNNALQAGPHPVPIELTENRADFEVSLSLIESRMVPMQAFNLGMRTVDQILAEAGVRIRWSDKVPPPSSKSSDKPCSVGITAPVIVMNFSESPKGVKPDTVAQSQPYAQDGVRITFFHDRLQAIFNSMPSWGGSVLGHIMAHEITHVLQGINRHSETGLMRAHWSVEDYEQMKKKSLPLTAYDIQLIRKGVVGWIARGKSDSCQPAP